MKHTMEQLDGQVLFIPVHYIGETAIGTAIRTEGADEREASLLDFLSNPNDLTQGGDK